MVHEAALGCWAINKPKMNRLAKLIAYLADKFDIPLKYYGLPPKKYRGFSRGPTSEEKYGIKTQKVEVPRGTGHQYDLNGNPPGKGVYSHGRASLGRRYDPGVHFPWKYVMKKASEISTNHKSDWSNYNLISLGRISHDRWRRSRGVGKLLCRTATQGNNVMAKTSTAINLDKMPQHVRAFFDSLDDTEKAHFLGFGGGARDEWDVPQFITTAVEQVISKGNSFIVLGLDRPHNILSGYGGTRSTHSAAIDIVAGRVGFRATKRDGKGELNYVDPNFQLDAARVYVSQKSNVDQEFQLNPGTVGNTTPWASP